MSLLKRKKSDLLSVFVALLALANSGFPQNANHKTLVTGKVVDQNGASIEFTKVSLEDRGGRMFETLTNGQGDYRLEVPPGTYRYRAQFLTHNAWESVLIEEYEVVGANQLKLDITLKVSEEFLKRNGTPLTGEPVTVTRPDKMSPEKQTSARTFRFAGTVLDRPGNPVGKVKLSVVEVGKQKVVGSTDEAGRFDVRLPTGVYTFEFDSRPFFCPMRIVGYTIAGDMSLDFVLTAPTFNLDDSKCKTKTINF